MQTDENTNQPAYENMLLVTKAISKGSGETAHKRSLARAFAVRRHGDLEEVSFKNACLYPKQETAHTHLKNYEPEKNILSFFSCTGSLNENFAKYALRLHYPVFHYFLSDTVGYAL